MTTDSRHSISSRPASDSHLTAGSRPSPGAEIAIDRLSVDDWERSRDIRLRALLADPEPFWRTYEEEREMPEEEWRARLAEPGRANFVARTGTASRPGADLGTISIGRPSWDETADPQDFDLAGMWVAPEARGTGAARLLMSAAIEHAREQGARSVTLWVLDRNTRAVALYERFGFAATGRTGVFPAPRNLPEHQRTLIL